MAEEHESSGSSVSPVAFALAFFGVIFAIWYLGNANGGGGIFGHSSSSLISLDPLASSTTPAQTGTTRSSWSAFTNRSTSIRNAPTNQSIERDLSKTSRSIETLEEDIRRAKLWGVVSPYKDVVSLRKGSSAGEDEASREYLSLSSSRSTGDPIIISGWTIESTVTGERLVLPLGTRLPRYSATTLVPIALEPREVAIITSGESPLGISFHENMCTGYLAEFQTFVPPLSRSCPRPRDDMNRFGNITSTDDTCFDAIARVSSCRLAPDSALDMDLSVACQNFLENDLSYQGCVRNHRTDPYFYKGAWRIYLEQNRDLWRSEREIIRLLDAEGKTVSVLEY